MMCHKLAHNATGPYPVLSVLALFISIKILQNENDPWALWISDKTGPEEITWNGGISRGKRIVIVLYFLTGILHYKTYRGINQLDMHI